VGGDPIDLLFMFVGEDECLVVVLQVDVFVHLFLFLFIRRFLLFLRADLRDAVHGLPVGLFQFFVF
jgi:hypothetical protein